MACCFDFKYGNQLQGIIQLSNSIPIKKYVYLYFIELQGK